MDHSIESGYGLIDDEGVPHVLDPDATAPVVQHLLDTSEAQGVRLLVRRRLDGGTMRTVDVIRGEPPFDATGEHSAP